MRMSPVRNGPVQKAPDPYAPPFPGGVKSGCSHRKEVRESTPGPCPATPLRLWTPQGLLRPVRFTWPRDHAGLEIPPVAMEQRGGIGLACPGPPPRTALVTGHWPACTRPTARPSDHTPCHPGIGNLQRKNSLLLRFIFQADKILLFIINKKWEGKTSNL